MSQPISLGKAKCVAATDKAIQVVLEEGRILWVPQSVVHDDSEVYSKGDQGELVVELWWAEQRKEA